MADDNSSRYRSSDPYGRGLAGGDPLAELARLIGQTDPFGEAARAQAPRPPQQADAVRPPAYDSGRPAYEQAPSLDWPAPSAPSAPKESYDPFAPPAQQAFAGDDAAYSDPHAGQEQGHDPYAPGYHSYGDDNAGHGAEAAAHQPDQLGFQPLPPAYRRDSEPPPDDFYDDAQEGGRRKGLVTVMAVLCLAVLGTAAAFGYRAMFGTSNQASPPPVIKASAEPTKVAPPPAAPDPSAGKISYDRFGDRSQNEQVVPREEKPVDPREIARTSAPRTILSGAPVASSAPAANAVTAMAAAAPPGNPPSVLTEPKRVRTVPIRPDQPQTAVANPQVPAPAAPPRQAVATAAPATAPAPEAAPPQAAPPRAAARAPANGPLSLSPDANVPPTATALAPTAPRAPAPARVAAAPAGNGGGYLVQVASQRSEADAQSSFRNVQSKYPNVLGDRQPVIRRADLGERGTYYRAMVGPFPNREQAVQFCGSLKAAGGDCVVQAN